VRPVVRPTHFAPTQVVTYIKIVNNHTQVFEEVVVQAAESRASTTSSVDVDEDIASTVEGRPPTSSSLASGRRSSHRPGTRSDGSPSTVSSQSRCSCSRRVTDIRAFGGSGAGFHSDGDVDDAVATATRQRLQRSLRSTASEGGGGAFTPVLPWRLTSHQRSHSNGAVGCPPAIAPDFRVVESQDHPRERTKEAVDLGAELQKKGGERGDWLNVRALMGEKRCDCGGRTRSKPSAKEAACQRRFLGANGDCAKAANCGVGLAHGNGPVAGNHWLGDVSAETRHPGGSRRRRRQVLSVVKSGAGLRAISETGDACRQQAGAAPSSSVMPADATHPVIRGLYRQPPPVHAASSTLASPSLTSSSSSSSSPVSVAAAVTRAGRQPDGTPSDDDCSDNSRQSI